jgi:hypothetical protein
MNAHSNGIAYRTAVTAREDEQEHERRCDDTENEQSSENQYENRSVCHARSSRA